MNELKFSPAHSGYEKAQICFENGYELNVFKGGVLNKKYSAVILKDNQIYYFAEVPGFYTQDGEVGPLDQQRLDDFIEKVGSL